jgi:acetylornithine deacetylase/succinyl-diaminopimelate desuccinylase-like protein
MDIELQRYIESHIRDYVEDLKRLCRQPSVAATNQGVYECAQLTKLMLEETGLEAQIIPTNDVRYPVVYATRIGSSTKNLLFYNHYDVQPAEPLELWDSAPFEPTERKGRIYARGVSDDKGHLVARLAAIKAILAVRGELPVGVKFCIEGAEEIGSPGFAQFVESHLDLLKSDACIWEGGGVDWDGTPQITLGLKGILYVELQNKSATRDSHSSYGTIITNPAWRLVWALSSIKDQNEKILIPGFYDEVIKPTPLELKAISNMANDDEQLKLELGITRFVTGVSGETLRRRHLLEPTCTICGIESGYTGEGTKTVLPAIARVKLDFRLVPNQSPEDILAKLKAHLNTQGFKDITINYSDGVPPSRTAMDSQFVSLVTETARDVYQREPILVPTMAGSGPMHSISQGLGVPIASSGISFPDEKLHAPNENARVDYFLKGILHAAAILDQFGRNE